MTNIIVSLLLALLAGQHAGSQPAHEQPSEITTDRPSFEVRPAQPVVGPVVPCTTDLDCIEKNPHIIEQPDCEWVGDACVVLGSD